MAKTYEQKMVAYKSQMRNMAELEVVNMKFQISKGDPKAASHFAARAARWIFTAYPELREAA